MRLEGKTAIVTGAAGGIGRASAEALAREGARLVLADLDGRRLEETAAALAAAGHTVVAERVDVTQAADVRCLVERCVDEFGRLDVMFNNAGIFNDSDGSVVDTAEAVWDRVLAVNLKGVFLGCKFAIPAMLAGGGGSIINTASFVALVGAAVSQCAYTASKGGVLALTREIAVEFARQGVRANALCPGPINTPLLADLLRDEAARQRRFVHIPVGRLGEAAEIAEAVVFLASDESSYVTGAEFVVDGGITAAYVTPE